MYDREEELCISTNSRFEITRQIHKSDYAMHSAHTHSYYEMYYLMNGDCSLILQDRIYNISSGTIVFIAPDIIHKTTYIGPEVQERLCIEFTRDYIDRLLQYLGNDWAETQFLNKLIFIPVEERPEISHMLATLAKEHSVNDSYSKIMTSIKFQSFIIELMRMNQQENSYPSCGKTQSVDYSVQKAFNYISNNYQNRITLNDVALLLHLNASYFSKKFKVVTGIGFKDYLNTVRINHSEKLLLETEKTITDIAFECGYDNSNYFGDIFKKYNKVSPSEFRRIKGNVQG